MPDDVTAVRAANVPMAAAAGGRAGPLVTPFLGALLLGWLAAAGEGMGDPVLFVLSVPVASSGGGAAGPTLRIRLGGGIMNPLPSAAPAKEEALLLALSSVTASPGDGRKDGGGMTTLALVLVSSVEDSADSIFRPAGGAMDDDDDDALVSLLFSSSTNLGLTIFSNRWVSASSLSIAL